MSLFSGVASIFGDHSSEYANYANQMAQLAKKLQPWIDAGKGAAGMFSKYSKMGLENPAFLENELADEYRASPYQTQIMDNTRNQMNTNSALTGMLGSTAQKAALQNQMAGLNQQFMNDYINKGMGTFNEMYGSLLPGSEMGLNALTQGKLPLMEEGDQANLAGDMSKDNAWGNFLGDFGSGFEKGLLL